VKAVVWIAIVGLGLPLYSYVVYPLLLFVLASLVQSARDARYLLSRGERRTRSKRIPSVSIIIAAHNEETVIAETLRHCLALDYPRERTEILVGSDGSTDRTAQIARRHEGQGVRVLEFPQRRGKLSVISDCAAAARGEILVFTDANTLLSPQSVRSLVRHFDDPRIGGVCGELRVAPSQGGGGSEGVYWRYEVVLKTLESRLGAVLGANGAIYALRKDLFPSLDRQLITDDFVIAMKVRARGLRVVYDPEAVAVEEAPSSVSEEFRRRMRIGAGNWQALRQCAPLLLPWKGFVSLAFLSHKVLRWFTPFLLAAGFFANLLLISMPTWRVVLAVQAAFYGAAGLGYALHGLHLPAGPLRLASYFVSVNAALGIGLLRGLLGCGQAAWQVTARQPVPARRRQQ